MRPFTLLVKPAGPDCNIDCDYCFYSCKSTVFGSGSHRMNDEVLEKFVRDYVTLRFPAGNIAFQGGEPTLMGLDFYKRVVELVKQYSEPEQVVALSLQTNGILLDDEWCEFLAANEVLVGISIDGPKKFHDIHRLDHAGKGTFGRVVESIERCKKHGVQFNTLTLMNQDNVDHADEIWDFLVNEMGIRFLQFIQCVERDPNTGDIAEFSITAQQYGKFMCDIFDKWLAHGVRKISVRTFDSLVSYCVGMGHTECTHMAKCADYVVIEHNGDVFACDFFVEDDWKLGSVLDAALGEIATGKQKRDFKSLKRTIADKCVLCRYLDVCRGGCLKDRRMGFGQYKVESYFCEGYKIFFDHAMPKFWEIAAQLSSEQPR
ncbi:MAG: anaerobic sulfatase maturase [Anaerohalosphaera sp.]|nr:anaerobic sulfatase maturase [Anaerohalosphaera sp.]